MLFVLLYVCSVLCGVLCCAAPQNVTTQCSVLCAAPLHTTSQHSAPQYPLLLYRAECYRAVTIGFMAGLIAREIMAIWQSVP